MKVVRPMKRMVWMALAVSGGMGFGSLNAHPYKIGIVQIVAHPALDKTQKGVVEGIQAVHPDAQIVIRNAQGNIVNATMIAQKFVSDGMDVVVAIGTAAAQVSAKSAQASQTPVVFLSITDPLGAKLVKDLNKPGGSVTGVSNYTEQAPQLAYFKELIPALKRLGVIYNPGEANSVSLLEKTTTAAKDLGIQIVPVVATKTTDVALAVQKALGSDIQGMFVNNDNTALAAFDVIVQLTQAAKTPLFVSDTDMVDQGALAALGPNQYDIGRQGAEIILAVLNGAKPGDLPVQFPRKSEKLLNQVVQKIVVKTK